MPHYALTAFLAIVEENEGQGVLVVVLKQVVERVRLEGAEALAECSFSVRVIVTRELCFVFLRHHLTHLDQGKELVGNFYRILLVETEIFVSVELRKLPSVVEILAVAKVAVFVIQNYEPFHFKIYNGLI